MPGLTGVVECVLVLFGVVADVIVLVEYFATLDLSVHKNIWFNDFAQL